MTSRCIEWRVRTIGTGIFLTDSLRVYEINSTAMRVFLMCDGKHSIDMMVSMIKDTFYTEHSNEQIRLDIIETLEILKNIGAIRY